MGAAVQLRDDFDGPSLRALANGCRNGPQSRRLLALVEICDGARRSDAARLAGVGPQIIRDSLSGSTSRHAREGGDPFNAEGPDGLINRKGSGPPSLGVVLRKRMSGNGWAKRGTRPHAPHDQRTKWAYIFGAICPAEGKGAGLITPWVDTHAMAEHLKLISAEVAPGVHAMLIVDQSGWHISPKLEIPESITLVPLPHRSPELNPVENVWQFIRQNWLSNRVFKNYDEIVALCCESWNKLMEQPWRIRSIGYRDWAYGF
ncbi:MAG: IS630 family transposase [Paracoccaceae bacterium]